MLVSMNWVKEFVDLEGEDLRSLIHRFTLSTAEVEDIFEMGGNLSGVCVGKILSCEAHPNSKKLHLLKVDGGDRVYDCVCGAPNAREGIYVAFAKPGANVNGVAIGEATIAGAFSEGMCCSEQEMGIGADHSGILELEGELTPGTDLKELYPIEDMIFEVDNKSLTNRPDLWGHYGIAREFSALTGKPLRPLDRVDSAAFAELPPLDITISDPELCFRYTGIRVENISVKRSPLAMRIRLFYCGSKGINLLADLTNYLMLEMGQPMHAFDNRLVQSIDVRRFPEEFSFETLDGETRTVSPETLMITSAGQPVAVAGVMGGLDSEITDATDSLLLESATFHPTSVRRTTVRLGLRTDASMRYEKALDPEMADDASERFLYLLSKIDGGAKVTSRLTDVYPKKPEPIHLEFTKAYVDRYTGIDISDEQILKTLTSLGFAVSLEEGTFRVEVPSWRATKDVTIPADIIEEITRIYGYDNFEIKSAPSPLRPVKQSTSLTDENHIKTYLAESCGLHEVHSYIWNDSKKLKTLGIEGEANVRILNSLASENETLRNCIVPSLLVFLYENRTFRTDFGIFECGRVVEGLLPDGTCNERRVLGIALFSRDASEKALYFRLRDILAGIGRKVKNTEFTFRPGKAPAHAWQHPTNTAAVLAGDREIGFLSVLHPANLDLLDKKAAVVFCQIDQDLLAEAEHPVTAYAEPSRFPGMDVDLSLIAGDHTYLDIRNAVARVSSPLIKGMEPTDVYEDGAVKSITVRIHFGSDERTLNRPEVTEVTDAILAELKKDGMELKQL